MQQKQFYKTVSLLFCVGMLWLFHFVFPLYRLHDGQVVRKPIWLAPVERLQWLQVPVAYQSRARRLSNDPSSSDYAMVDYRPTPYWINSGSGSRSRRGGPTRNPSLIVAIWGTIFITFFLGSGNFSKVRPRIDDDSRIA